ncbi:MULTISPECIES: twin-arginine translocase TatA/TatE family subunit [Parachlamydia]|jgi:sec-independent protein translocase protein TatA|uniref:Sec-independent protein translocase protein TatA n=2 Tax=Parachlamydia acanthamoebae TaxID=83552 RepID=F8KVH3_PARAV|nr:twin-arginine translocase TatA/TatE family subunit [Parachlamydia acanthamoebae]EFB42015.1 hypothetical protein pah_c016o052 [Parachlamydia acanthamoebae str. Hall's coccus]KIA76619.1 Sec-independent protein translocase protein TatA [Parachlamydia acanthamoebae]CCB87705.1 sec-independent protein translocase protein tatA/E homolog [Parachlamydia acanthamoebae UV-7]
MIGTGELIVIFCVILLLFGGKKLPELAKSLGRAIREFKKACEEDESQEKKLEPSRIRVEESNPSNDL